MDGPQGHSSRYGAFMPGMEIGAAQDLPGCARRIATEGDAYARHRAGCYGPRPAVCDPMRRCPLVKRRPAWYPHFPAYGRIFLRRTASVLTDTRSGCAGLA